ncbi:DUF305 domain-containing protein [Nonomuraea sp. 10N515B]|uniref:DUF305 domain-containing protein n=1 Tax=Nonomuraea sp. 10N515B TaxID=3457422 RepID=UPI003FCD3C60
MKRSALAGIAAGSVLAATAVTGIAVGDSPSQHTLARQPAASPSGRDTVGSHHPMRAPIMSDEAGYLAHMVAHHQEAVQAARQLQRSSRTEMRSLGSSIVTTQSAEIATMKKWLAAWYPGHSHAADYRPMMRDLSKLSDDALDKAFLRDMIPHHMMAVMMSQQLLMHGRIQHGDVAAFAAKVRDDQHAELVRMQQYLADWFNDWSMPCPMASHLHTSGPVGLL